MYQFDKKKSMFVVIMQDCLMCTYNCYWLLANISIKKRVHDQVMLTRRLHEETSVLVLEMAQHCMWLQSLAMVLKNKLAEEGKFN